MVTQLVGNLQKVHSDRVSWNEIASRLVLLGVEAEEALIRNRCAPNI
jgi:hypothetical protein